MGRMEDPDGKYLFFNIFQEKAGWNATSGHERT